MLYREMIALCLNLVKWTKQSEVEWGEVKCSRGRGGGRVFMEKFYRSSKWWEVKGSGENVNELTLILLTWRI